MSDIRLRFPPSPTGRIHIGNIRTALFNWLWARKNNGTLVLRIEDTDLDRSTREFEDVIIKELDWLGLDVDEGVSIGGEYGPYRQSERLEIYQKYVDRLLKQDKAYKCYCSKEDLEKMRAEQKEAGEVPHYDGRCRNLSSEEKSGSEYVVRFKMPTDNREIVVNDQIRGEVIFNSKEFDDFVIQKTDGMATYNFAVVIDDALMKISDVIRGEDHLTNTPKQIMLYQALDFPIPNFAHLPLILDETKAKLKKRSDQDEVFVGEFREKGYLPEALFNFLALLGWSPGEEKEIMDKEEIVNNFELNSVNKSGAVFDVEKLNWMNGEYIKKADLDRLYGLSIPYLIEAGYIDNGKDIDKDWLIRVIDLVRDGLDYLAQLPDEAELFFTEFRYEDIDEAKKELEDPDVKEVFQELIKGLEQLDEFTRDNISTLFNQVRKEVGVGGRKFFHPLRLALTGKGSGPGLVEFTEIIGKEEAINRLENALSLNK
ncbi:MAG: glutamate--tRNA ligase [Bacillota bacterium]